MQSSKTTEEKEKNKDQIYITFRLKDYCRKKAQRPDVH